MRIARSTSSAPTAVAKVRGDLAWRRRDVLPRRPRPVPTAALRDARPDPRSARRGSSPSRGLCHRLQLLGGELAHGLEEPEWSERPGLGDHHRLVDERGEEVEHLSTSGGPARTASAETRSNPPEKTDARAKAIRSSSSSMSKLHSRAARIVRWRSPRARPGAASRSSRSCSRRSRSSNGTLRRRAAASRSPAGCRRGGGTRRRPQRPRPLGPKRDVRQPGEVDEQFDRVRLHLKGRTGITHSPATPRIARSVASTRSRGQCVHVDDECRGVGDDVLAIVEHEEDLAVTDPFQHRPPRRLAAAWQEAEGVGDGSVDVATVADVGEADEQQTPPMNSCSRSWATASDSRVLPTPPGPSTTSPTRWPVGGRYLPSISSSNHRPAWRGRAERGPASATLRPPSTRRVNPPPATDRGGAPPTRA